MAHSKSKRRSADKQGPRSGFRFLKEVLAVFDTGPLLDAIGPPAPTGRPPFPAAAMVNAYLSKLLLGFRYNLELLERLRASPALRHVLGFGEQVPSESTYSRFATRLIQHRRHFDEGRNRVAAALLPYLPGLGETVAVDATAIASFSNPHPRKGKGCSDREAAWGVKHSARAKVGGKEYFFGFKLHLVADAKYGVPMAHLVTPGNRNDSPVLPELLQQTRANHKWPKLRYVLADRGYDSSENNHTVVEQGAIPIIHRRRPQDPGGLEGGIYDVKGHPACLGMVPMDYIRTDPDSGHHLFRCRGEGCHLKALHGKGTSHCDLETWEDPMENLRAVGIIWRGGKEWKERYRMRTDIERVFRSLKHSRGLEGYRVRGMEKISLLISASLWAYAATMLARLLVGDGENYRIMRIRTT